MVSKISANIKSQLFAVNKTLSDLRPLLTASDRLAAQKELGLSEPTITRYLNGKAKQLDTALNLKKFFRERLEERQRDIAA